MNDEIQPRPKIERLSVAERKRRQRKRLRDAGLMAVEIWVPPEQRGALRRIEKLLREGVVPDLPSAPEGNTGGDVMNIELLRESLNNLTSGNGFSFAATQMDGNEAIEVVVEDRAEFPIMVWFDGEQILAVTYLWDEKQVTDGSKVALLSTLLELNVPLPLSSFGKIGGHYVIFGSLLATSSMDNITTELEVLSDNTLEAIEIVAPYLKSSVSGGQ